MNEKTELSQWYEANPAPSMSMYATQADYWKAMYEHREAEAHQLSEELIRLRAASPSSKSTKEAPFDSEYVRNYLEEVLEQATGNADPEVRKLLEWLASSSIKEDGERAEYTGELWQDAICERFAAAGFKYDGFGSWQADLTTTEMLALAAALSSPPSPLGDTPDQQEKKQ